MANDPTTSAKQVKDLAEGDPCFMFGGRNGPPDGTEMVVHKVGRTYLYVKSPTNRGDRFASEFKFDRERGLEVLEIGNKRQLVVDRDAWIDHQHTRRAYAAIRQHMGYQSPAGIPLADVLEAARLLQIDISKE